jgi:hypothetical protein
MAPGGNTYKNLASVYIIHDAHAVWSGDGKYIMWNSGEYGFKDEAACTTTRSSLTGRSGS